MPGKIQVVVGGQFGSEGKGHCAAELAQREGVMLAVRTGGPNAGHTAIGDDPVLPLHRHEFKLRQLPVAPVVNNKATAAIAARSLVQMDLVESEAREVGLERLFIDPAATLLESGHIAVEQEDDALKWGSTQKGIGAARMDRLHRTARTYGEHAQRTSEWSRNRIFSRPVIGMVREHLASGYTVQIEAAQGYGLGLHTEFYPKTTSADCRAIDALADVGISPWEFPDTALEIWIVVRPYPIRVAGDSGPLKHETTWAALDLPEERTTVTNKVRRVGGWDPSLVSKAVRANGIRDVRLWMNMADHVFRELTGRTSLRGMTPRGKEQVWAWVHKIQEQVNAPIHALGTGPDTAIFLGE